ncbi:SDR family oxidoreductase [Hyphomicrobium sp.]|uniref:SDR family oxidoreductase n=1 Tax=Hyphomicrobium sp. TaxID=82 RepID=UPI002E35A105|nr:SDR family oxidoreductase [Hyphomicrobium sp.]HEX2843250.1 SDR family oxidoreductase [Hyphomicrobium sp.]
MPTVLVTGANSGIGLATSVELAKRGWNVVATMRDREKRGALEQALRAAGVTDLVRIERLDVTDEASIDTAIATLDLAHRPLDAVVNNAGIAIGGAFEDLSDAQVRRVMEVNFFGVLALTRRLLPKFRAQRRGRILIVSSEAAFAGNPTISAYTASKWAVEGWAESLAHEVEPFNVQVVLVEPGAVKTNIWEASPRIIPQDSPYRPLLRHLDAAVDMHVAKTAREPEDVAKVIANALEATKPRFRTAIGPTARMLHVARGKVPTSVMRKIFGYYFGLNRVRW